MSTEASTPSPEPCELSVKQYDRGDISLHLRALTGYCLGYGDIYYRTEGAGVGLSLCIDGVYVRGADDHYHATPRDALRAAIICMRDNNLDVRRVVFDGPSAVGVLV